MTGHGTIEHFFAATLAVFAGAIVEGILGFGCSLVWMSFFPLFTTVPDAVGVLQPMHIALNMILLASIWRKCTPRELRPLALTVPFGIVFGLWIVTSWSSNSIDFVLGIFLIVYTLLKNDEDGHGDHGDEETVSTDLNRTKQSGGLKRRESFLELDPLDEIDFIEEKKDDRQLVPTVEEMPHPTLGTNPLTHRNPMSPGESESLKLANLHKIGTPSKLKSISKQSIPATSKLEATNSSSKDMLWNPTGIGAGLVGGALMGAFGTGGPAFLIYAKEAGWQKRPEIFRANLQLLFFVVNVPVCLSQVAEGIITFERCKASCCLLPALLAGGHVGGMMAKSISREKFQILVVNGLRIMGLMFLIEATRES